MATAANARAYWEQAAPSFAHITSAQQQYISGWKKQWLNPLLRLMPPHALRNACAVDVGVGGGALGVLLLEEHAVRHYHGVDIAQRQLDAARKALVAHRFTETPADDDSRSRSFSLQTQTCATPTETGTLR